MAPINKAPQFKLQDQDGNYHSLNDYSGNWLVIYIYPKDGTPGCTKEACAFRDGRDILKQMGAEVIGISRDSVTSHSKFHSKHKLNHTILSDPSGETIRQFDSLKIKKIMGKEFSSISRDTFIINPSGEIVKKYVGVNPITHFEKVLEDLRKLVSLQ